MVFSNQAKHGFAGHRKTLCVLQCSNFAKPTREEIAEIKWIIENNPEDLDSRELWVLENFAEGDEDD